MATPRNRAALLVREIRYRLVLFLRNRRAIFFTLFFPMMFLFLFSALNKGAKLPPSIRGGLAYTQFFAPGIAVFGVISACYTGLAMSTVMARDSLSLKRMRGTPLPPWIYLAGRIGSMLIVSFVSVAIMFTAAVLLFGVTIDPARLPGIALTVIIGGACFSALGLAITGAVSTAESAPAVVNFTILPLTFISNIFFPADTGPTWLRVVGWLFPIKHMATALQDAFDPGVATNGIDPLHLGVLLAWFAAGLILAVKYFRWEPKLPEMTVPRRLRGRAGTAP